MDRRRVVTLSCAGVVLAAIVALGRTPRAAAELRVPTDPAEILERLPEGPRSKELQARRRALQSARTREAALNAALALATLEIQRARELGDPRHLGRAQAALAPWWDAPDAPAEVLVLRATVEQSLHDFDAALRDLDRALALAPDAAQAWLTRSVVLTVRGRYDEARASCDAFERVEAAPIPVAICRTAIASVTGDARGAYDRLRAVLDRAGSLGPDEEAWALSSLGELAEGAGLAREAEDAYRRALDRDAADTYTRAALADLLLDQHRGAEAVPLLAGRESNDALLLRLAFAEKQAGMPFATHDAELAARFEASGLRGDVVHRREEARFWLTLRGDAARALSLAKANWDVQHERWDARIYLEAALAAQAPREAEPVLAWIATTHLEHPAIQRAVAALNGAGR